MRKWAIEKMYAIAPLVAVLILKRNNTQNQDYGSGRLYSTS